MNRSFILIAALVILTLIPPFVGTANALPVACLTFNNRPVFCIALFDDEATLSADGRQVTASGAAPPCTPEEKTVRILDIKHWCSFLTLVSE